MTVTMAWLKNAGCLRSGQQLSAKEGQQRCELVLAEVIACQNMSLIQPKSGISQDQVIWY